MKVESLNEAPLIRALFYGDSGSGKTRLIGSAMECAATSPLLVLNARGQPISLRAYDPRPLVLTIEKMTDFNVVWDWFMAGQPTHDWNPGQPPKTTVDEMCEYLYHLPHYTSPEGVYREGSPSKFKSIAIDSITQVQRISLDGVVGNAQKKPGDMPQQTQIQHWGRTLAQLTKLADLFYQLPVNVFINALTRHNEIKALGITMYHPFLWGQSALEVPSYAELVGRLVTVESLSTRKVQGLMQAEGMTEEPFNVLLTRGGRNFIAKWQGVTDPPEFVINPTIARIHGYVNDLSGRGAIFPQEAANGNNH